ncbi:PEP-CTERM sorting domain-containing protein [Posidoniimonas corsicana]|uniref:PEP-CTERM sorting domain-containing protein n=1 Tax=Posidoniimonas corsicana TaxID=1938618 RepID=UPI0011B7CD13|nr:PEP-CTERM sorting domain-containing protein [Posidoniimonas corsicana]
MPSIDFDESATIGDPGSIAQVTDTPPTPIGLTINSGAVEVASTGSLSVVTSPNVGGSGGATINANGRISVASGGSFSSVNLTVNGALEMGSTANVSASQGITFNGGSTFSPQLTSSSFNAISTPGPITLLGGTVSLDFGYTPSPSDTWDVFDGGSVVGNMPEVEVNSGLTLDPWQKFAIRTSAGGANGAVGTLQLEDRVVLSINRSTGVGTITNMSGGAIDLDGYVIESGLGSINPAAFNSFSSQSLDGGSWGEFGELVNESIGELRREGITSLAPGASRSIGAVFDPTVTELGTDYEDLSFSYTNEQYDSIGGVVVYEGNKKFNNLVLNVNPVTGDAVLVNESPLSITIDGYAVKSASGALLTGGWSSLEDQGAAGGDWLEIGANSGQLGELKAAGATVLTQGTSYNLGAIFNTAGEEDLTLEFFFADEDAAPSFGVVSYEEPAGAISGDYNGNGIVDAADYTIFRDSLGGSAAAFADGTRNPGLSGPVGTADYEWWRDNFGASGAVVSSAGAVPEPLSMLLGCFALTGLASRRRGVVA